MSHFIGNIAVLMALISAAYLIFATIHDLKKRNPLTLNSRLVNRENEGVVDHLNIDPTRTFDLFED